MKGIILAGGKGTRLRPLTLAVSKQLLPINDKPMIFYPLSTLMMARIKDILIISSEEDIDNYKRLFEDGSHLGLNITYASQSNANGIAEAFIIGKDFIGDEEVCLILGDNIFYGLDYSQMFQKSTKKIKGAKIFGYEVSNPDEFGVVEFDKKGKVKSIEEKPKFPKSNYAIVGLYMYDNSVIEISENLKPSSRGELEITDGNKEYLKKSKLNVEFLNDGVAWLDTGTHNSLLDASHFVSAIEKRQAVKIGCIDEVAFKNHWINKKQLLKNSKMYSGTPYGDYLIKIAKRK